MWLRACCLVFRVLVGLLAVGLGTDARAQTATTRVCAPDLERQIAELIAARDPVQALSLVGKLAAATPFEVTGDHPCRARALLFRGAIVQQSGRHSEAGEAFEGALAIFRKAVPRDDPELTLTLNNLGVQRFWMRDYEAAARLHEEALQLRSQATPRDDLAIADSLHNLADAYRYLGRDYKAVEGLYRRSLAIRRKLLKPDDSRIGNSLQNLASALELQGDFKGAANNLLAALAIYRQSAGTDETLVAAVMNRLAGIRFVEGQLKEAERYFRAALDIFRQMPQTQRWAMAATLDDFAINQIGQGALDEAASLLGEALTLRKSLVPADHPTISRTLSNLADVESRKGSRDRALELIREASAFTISRDAPDQRSRFQFQRHLRMLWAEQERRGKEAPSALLDEAFVIAQRATRTDTANTVARMTSRFSAGNERLRDLLKEGDDLERQRAAIEAAMPLAFNLPEADGAVAFREMRKRLEEIAAREASIAKTVQAEFPAYVRLVKPTPLDVRATQSQLRSDETLVLLVSTPLEAYVFAITRTQALWHKVRLEPESIERDVRRLRASLDVEDLRRSLKTSSLLFDLEASHRLYQALFGPVAHIIERTRHLIFVPSGAMTGLPAQVLVVQKPSGGRPTVEQLDGLRGVRWLIDVTAISVAPAVSNLTGFRSSRAVSDNRKPMVGFGNPRFGEVQHPAARNASRAASKSRKSANTRTRGLTAFWRGGTPDYVALKELSQLPETESEIRTVARFVGAREDDLFLGEAATESKVKGAPLSQYSVVYFATHGLVAGELRGLGEPALALTLPEQPGEHDDGLLTSSEVAQLQLDADWVVLSACNTAAEDRPGAEALSGLARAFFHAGARALLVSHWRVGSAETADLITKTFEVHQRQPEKGRAEAMRSAILSYKQQISDPWSAHPAFWGGFSLVGEGGMSN